MNVEVPFYSRHETVLQCGLCPHKCRIKPGARGICRVRANEADQLVATNYGEVASAALDPIEKKPLYHFFPGTGILSVGTIGCNLSCGFCQNYHLSRQDAATRYLPPQELADLAAHYQVQGSIGVAYTYSEPMMWYEYIMDAAPLVRAKGLKNVLVTNGYINPEPFERMLPFIDAMNIDLKSFRNRFYLGNCKARLEPVLETIQKAVGRTHVELTTLIIPDENDSIEEIDEMTRWIASLDPNIPFHISRYHPAYKFTRPATSTAVLEDARHAARAHLKNVYVGNAEGFDNHSYCPHCGEVLVERIGYQVRPVQLTGGYCETCGKEVPFIQ